MGTAPTDSIIRSLEALYNSVATATPPQFLAEGPKTVVRLKEGDFLLLAEMNAFSLIAPDGAKLSCTYLDYDVTIRYTGVSGTSELEIEWHFDGLGEQSLQIVTGGRTERFTGDRGECYRAIAKARLEAPPLGSLRPFFVWLVASEYFANRFRALISPYLPASYYKAHAVASIMRQSLHAEASPRLEWRRCKGRTVMEGELRANERTYIDELVEEWRRRLLEAKTKGDEAVASGAPQYIAYQDYWALLKDLCGGDPFGGNRSSISVLIANRLGIDCDGVWVLGAQDFGCLGACFVCAVAIATGPTPDDIFWCGLCLACKVSGGSA